ncbi:carbohydrate-binding domain-containing protein [Propionibacterium freudenreichii]|uniref:carbohydrate-binding domain-containing protein n=1 Tax=Propionibacterium freudenreichii TaxID=1744 RepID=UPI0021A91B97|nr:carbohydrate-binding domain-containing protein [Propionibacterium freudenreichii]MCT3014496.1 carbohydrate-binding domain-containing protein [Propionibacterium freudenreichii]
MNLSWQKRLAALAVAATLTGCGATTASSPTTTASAQAAATSVSSSAQSVLADNKDSHYKASDLDYEASSVVTVTLSGSSASASGPGVGIDGSTVTITEPGTYKVSGQLTDGRLVVNSTASGETRIILDGADITSSSGPAIDIQAADEVNVILADGSQNTLTDGSGYDTSADGAANAALYSRADLTIAGTGSLSVDGRTNDGIASTDGLVIVSGTIRVQAIDDGIRGKDYVIVEDGTINVTSGGDGIKSDNSQDSTRAMWTSRTAPSRSMRPRATAWTSPAISSRRAPP